MEETGIFYDATNSWHGYNYQGKTAIYVTLRIINYLYETGNHELISRYYLEIEWLEDFAILFDSEGHKSYESIHQVKAREGTQLNNYAEALTNLLRKVQIIPTIKHAYLHTQNSISYFEGRWAESLREVVTSGNELKKIIGLIDQYLKDQDLLRELSHNINKPGRPTSFITALKRCAKCRITADNILHFLSLYKTQLVNDIMALQQSKTQLDIEKLSLFAYQFNGAFHEFCPSEKIDELIKAEIRKYWTRFPGQFWKSLDINLLQSVLYYIIGYIDEHITIRHENYGSSECRQINFSNIEELLSNDIPVNRCVEYYLTIAKYRVLDYCDKYHDRCIQVADSAQCNDCQISSLVAKMENLKFDDFKEFLMVTNPDVNGKIDINSLDLFCNSYRYNDPFLKGLTKITKPFEKERLPISFSTDSKELYLLTALGNDGAPQSKQAICRSIIANSDIPNIFMDYDILLSKDISSNSIYDDAGDFLGSFKIDKDNIYHFKQVQIKPMQECIETLNVSR